MRALVFLVSFLALLVGGLIWLFLTQEDQDSLEPELVEQPAVISEEPQTPEQVAEPEVRYPVPGPLPAPSAAKPAEESVITEASDQPAPVLDDSDQTIQEALQELLDAQRFEALFLPEMIVRHFVVTIDNMTRRKLPQKFAFTTRPPGNFTIRKDAEERLFLDPKNYQRYASFIELADVVEIKSLVALYVRYYPLFQQAYEELGYPNRYFNDRLVEVIDHLLASPAIRGPIELEQPKVFYVFADPELEALSAGQKIMIRIGPDNAERVKKSLSQIRMELTALHRP